MSKRIDKSWVVFVSVENDEHDRCVDIFFRPDGTFGFEEFRRDIEDRGEWTPLGFYSGATYPSSEAAYAAGERTVPWFADILARKPGLRRHPNPYHRLPASDACTTVRRIPPRAIRIGTLYAATSAIADRCHCHRAGRCKAFLLRH